MIRRTLNLRPVFRVYPPNDWSAQLSRGFFFSTPALRPALDGITLRPLVGRESHVNLARHGRKPAGEKLELLLDIYNGHEITPSVMAMMMPIDTTMQRTRSAS